MEEEKRYRQFISRQFYKLVCREEWNDREFPTEAEPLRIPLIGIILSHTETKRCRTPDECLERVREVQRQCIEKGMPDMHYNFLVGGDGHIYEGMGWHDFLPKHIEVIKGGEKLFGRSIEVAFIDKHTKDPNDPMQRGLGRIITMGLTERFLVDGFSFFCRTDDRIEFIESRDKARERKLYLKQKRRERKDPNYRKEKKEKINIDMEAIKKEFEKTGMHFPSKT